MTNDGRRADEHPRTDEPAQIREGEKVGLQAARETSSSFSRPRANQRAGPRERQCRPGRGRKAGRRPPAGDRGRLEVGGERLECGLAEPPECLRSARTHARLLWQRPLLGSRDHQARPHGEADRAGVREAACAPASSTRPRMAPAPGASAHPPGAWRYARR